MVPKGSRHLDPRNRDNLDGQTTRWCSTRLPPRSPPDLAPRVSPPAPERDRAQCTAGVHPSMRGRPRENQIDWLNQYQLRRLAREPGVEELPAVR